MSLESPVVQISDLDATWPLSSDLRHYGDDHLRVIKVAVKSLRDGTYGVRQLGFDTVEQTLSAASTAIDYTGLIQRGCRVTVILKQDATGGRLITWAAKFKLVSVDDISLVPSTYSVFDFVGAVDGNLYLTGPPNIGRT